MPYKHFQTNAEWDGTVVITMDRSDASANSLSREMRRELDAILDVCIAKNVPGVIIASAKPAFSVGADVHEFQNTDQILDNINEGHALFRKLANAPFPSVAAINGYCLGGGLELALACTHRVASTDALLGLPEVRLGIHPGWGGTARLPELVGGHVALPLMLQGKNVKARQALKMGLVDAVVAEPNNATSSPSSAAAAAAPTLIDTARRHLYNARSRSLVLRVITWISNTWFFRQVFGQILLWKTSRTVDQSQYPSPFHIIKLWRTWGNLEDRIANEAASIMELSTTPTAHNLIKIFLMQEKLKKGDKASHGIKHVHIIGDTVLAGDIAALAAINEFTVTLSDDVLRHTTRYFDRKSSPSAVRSRVTLSESGLASADLVIEALPEVFEQKKQVLETVEPQLKNGALLATTSGIFSLERLGTGLKSADLVGLHFFDPVGVVPLVEVAQTYETARMVSFIKALGKLPIVVKSSPGLLVTRCLVPYVFEALYMVEEGIAPYMIDRAAHWFGMPIGPLELIDRQELDVWAAAAKETASLLGLRIPEALKAPTKRGKVDGQGIYKWVDDKPIKDHASGTLPVDRLMFALICEAIAASNSKITAGPDLVDAAIVFSTGFAPFRGGPINYSKERGDFEEVMKKMQERGRFVTRRREYFTLRDD